MTAPDLPHLHAEEQEHYRRAHNHLERTDLLAAKPPRGVNQELLYEGRYAARGAILLAQTLNAARARPPILRRPR